MQLFSLIKLLATAFMFALLAFLVVELIEPTRISHPRIMTAFPQMQGLDNTLQLYYSDHDRFPTDSEGLEALLPDNNSSGYVKRFPTDPWGNPYVYKSSENSYSLYSVGVNRIDDGGFGDDVTDLEKEYSCSDYYINCPTPPIDYLRYGSVIVGACSAFLLIILSAFYLLRSAYRSFQD